MSSALEKTLELEKAIIFAATNTIHVDIISDIYGNELQRAATNRMLVELFRRRKSIAKQILELGGWTETLLEAFNWYNNEIKKVIAL